MKTILYTILTAALGVYFVLTYRACEEECVSMKQVADRSSKIVSYSVCALLVALVVFGALFFL